MITEPKISNSEGRKMHAMLVSTARQLEKVKDEKKFRSAGETIQYLLDLESDLQKSGKISDKYKCKKCKRDATVTEEMALDLHKIRHRNCKSEDPNDKNCDGMLWRTYGLNESNDKNSGQTDTNERQKTQSEIDEEYRIGTENFINQRKLALLNEAKNLKSDK